MIETPRLSLPLLQAAQAQKHITLNESLVRLDGLTQLVLNSVGSIVPPGLATDGDCFAVPVGATNAWAGKDGHVAVYSNGGWIFIMPKAGWRAWISDTSSSALFDGANWIVGAVAVSPNGAAMVHEVIETDHFVSSGATSIAVGAIPGASIVFGVTGRVTQTMGGTLTGWQLGVAGTINRYGSNLGVQAGNWVRGLTGTPVTYFDPEDLILTAEGADFVDGSVRLAVSLMRLSLPNT
ncbi:MAG: DUF2793 domain-containing protein [Paracoccaceae bacterium]